MTNEVISQTLAEVEEMIPRLEWEILDEAQKDEFIAKIVERKLYMTTTSDGAKLGPTFWASKVGATMSAIESRVRRLRSSQIQGDDGSARANQMSAKRHAKSVLRTAKPEDIAEMLDDPEVRQNVAAAQRVHEFRQENRTGIPPRNPSTAATFISHVVKINGWLDELIGMVEGGERIPGEFSTQSLIDMGRKVMRLQEIVDDARESETEGVGSHV